MSITWKFDKGIETAVADSALDFIEALRPSNDHWWDGGSSPWVFRGHAQETWPLLPAAWRAENVIISNSKIEAATRFDIVQPRQHLNWFWQPNFWSRAAPFGEDDASLSKELTIATTAEYLPVWDFFSRCDELGMPTPLLGTAPDPVLEPNWLADPSNPLVGDELLRFSDFPGALALAQHHGVPTRLLDWTRNPMAAAYFATEPMREIDDEANLVVWALHKRNSASVTLEGTSFPGSPGGIAQRFDPTIAVVRPSTRYNPFLAAQEGLFTTISKSGIYFMKNNGKRPALEDFVVEASPSETVLRKLILSHTHAADLIEILRREKISRSALMPTLDNVARDVVTKWRQGSI